MYLRKDLAYKFVNEFVDDRGCVISTITTYMTLLTCGKIVLTEKCDTYDYDMGSWDVDAQNYIPWHECEYKSEIDGKNFFGAFKAGRLLSPQGRKRREFYAEPSAYQSLGTGPQVA